MNEWGKEKAGKKGWILEGMNGGREVRGKWESGIEGLKNGGKERYRREE